jgi:hypothetical protein
MDELEAYFGKDKLMARAIENALLELAAERVGVDIWEWGQVGLVLGLDLMLGEGCSPQVAVRSNQHSCVTTVPLSCFSSLGELSLHSSSSSPSTKNSLTSSCLDFGTARKRSNIWSANSIHPSIGLQLEYLLVDFQITHFVDFSQRNDSDFVHAHPRAL